MRLAILSDTHLPRGSRALPQSCLERLRSADLILHAGDIATVAVLEQIEAIGPPVHAVFGNVDEPALRARLPETRVVHAGTTQIAMVHDAGAAAGRLKRMRKRFPEADAVVFGHSHIPLHEHDFDASFQIFNPGSPTDRRRQPKHTMGIATVTGDDVGFELVALD